jgi:hypothetical protein
MGCDIHAFVEFERWGSYVSLTRGTLNISRDYALFTVLALGPGGITDDLPYPPRGLPDGLSSDTQGCFYSPADEVIQFMAENYSDGGEVLRPEEYAADVGQPGLKEFLQNRMLPTVELHSHSWLTIRELKEVLAHGKLSNDKLSPDFCAIVAAMDELAQRYGDTKVRLVFAFDG